MMQRAALIGGLWLVACGPASAPAPASPSETSPSPVSEPSAAAPTVEAPPPSDAPGLTAPPAPAEAKPVTPSVREACLAMCDKVKEKCGKSAFESCRVNCGKYDPPAEGCEDVV